MRFENREDPIKVVGIGPDGEATNTGYVLGVIAYDQNDNPLGTAHIVNALSNRKT